MQIGRVVGYCLRTVASCKDSEIAGRLQNIQRTISTGTDDQNQE